MGKLLNFFSILFVLVSYVYGCSDLGPGARASGKAGDEYDEDARKIFYSEVVVFGWVAGNVSGNYPFNGISGVYTIQFDVRCTYKGGSIPSTIFIAGIGNTMGELPNCPMAPLHGSNYAIMFLKRTERPEVFEVEFKPNVGPVEILLDDLCINCGIKLEENYDDVCEEFLPIVEDCVAWRPVVVTTSAESTTPNVDNITPSTIKQQAEAQKSLEEQLEEINALRAQMLREYEQMLSVRTEVMTSQSEEVGKLQQEMAQIQRKYEDQMADFQEKVKAQIGNRNLWGEDKEKSLKERNLELDNQRLELEIEKLKLEIILLKKKTME